MQESESILKKYWKHDRFRPLQKEIIDSVLNGKDTFALLPTGGGKSVCFQIPALMREGICLVISPLVALMKDQVANLQKLDIKAIALTGGIQSEEMIMLLDNCQFGNYKFLYLSPERLQSDWILERIKNLPINLIAIDEAHCVSQWGHDFRPAYLKISNLKTHFPKTPFLALTASATKTVLEDTIVQLKLEAPVVFQQSFERPNLAYMVFEVDDKWFRMEQILKKYPNIRLTFCEPDRNELKIAQSRIKGKNVIFLTSPEYIENASQDKVYSFAVLEHVWDQRQFFNEVSRILKKSGAGYISYDDGHFRNYLYKDDTYAFQFRNFLKTKLHKLWRTLRIYRKYQFPVNASKLVTTLDNTNLKIIDEYYSNIDNFKNFRIKESVSVFRENCAAVYDLEKALNIEYQKYYNLDQRVGMHGPLWKVMGTRTIKVVPTNK